MPPENDYSDFFESQTRQATSMATAAMYSEQDPDQAARAIELGGVTGEAPAAILPNLDNVERGHKSMLSQELIRRNRFLQEYFNSDPMAAKLSHDDVAQLDQASQALQGLNRKSIFQQLHEVVGPIHEAIDPFQIAKSIRGATEEFGTTIGEQFREIAQARPDADSEFAKNYPQIYEESRSTVALGRAAISGIMAPFTGALSLMHHYFGREAASYLEYEMMRGDIRATGTPKQAIEIKQAWDAARPWTREGKDPPPGVSPVFDKMKVDDAEADAKALDEVVRTSNATQTLQRVRDIAADFYANNFSKQHGDSKVLIDANAIARLYGSARPEPDDGLLGWIDNLSQRLDATIGSSGYIDVPAWEYASKIDPEVHKELRDDLLLREHGFTVNEAKEVEEPKRYNLEGEVKDHGEGYASGRFAIKREGEDEPLGYVTTSYSPESKELYTDIDAASINKLGYSAVRGLLSQLREKFPEAEAVTGERISGARLAAGATGQARISLLPKAEGTRTLENPEQVLRGSAGLEPLLAVGDRKLTLQKRPTRIEGDVIKSDEFKILDENGQNVGWLEVVPYDDGKRIYIDNIGGMESKGYHPNSFGPALIRSIRQQLKQAYPQMEQIGGFRISGAREKAGTEREVWIKAEQGDLEAERQFHNLLNAKWETVGDPTVEALFKTDDKGLAANSPLGQMVLAELKRIAPHIDADVVHGITYKGDQIFGGYLPNLKKIIVSLESPNVFDTARHEAGHGFKDLGLFTDQEWSTLESAALTEGWLKKHKIGARYPELDPAGQVEEAIMHAYPDWVRGQKIPEGVVPLFQRIKDFLDGLLKKVADHLGLRADSWQDIFHKMETGEVGVRPFEDTSEAMVTSPRQQKPEGPKLIDPINIRLPFAEGKAIGISQKIYRNFMKLIKQRHEADLQADFAKIYDKERRTQTREWKENAAATREQVTSELDEKPNILLDRLMSERAGNLKLDPMSIREDLREVLPPEYMRRTNSMSADDLAGYFGYPSGDALVEHLAELAQDRKASGLSHKEYVGKLIDDEVNRRMEAQYGFLEKNILEDAKDRAFSQNQIDILDQQVVLLAEQAGVALPLERSALVRELRDSFNRTPVGSISSDQWLKASNTAYKDIRDALLKGDAMEALKAQQRQHNAVLQGKWAHEYEKQRKSLDKTAKQMGKVTPENMLKSSIEPEFINHIQDQLYRVGYTGRRSWENIRENIGLQREKTLEAFVNYHLSSTGGMRDLPVADFMIDQSFQAPIDKLTAEQFTNFKRAIDGLVKNGRDLKTYETAQGKIALEDARKMFIDRLSEGRDAKLPAGPDARPSFGRSFVARLTSMPTVANLFDRLDRNGPWNELIRKFLGADTEKVAWEKEIEKEWKAIADYGDLKKKIAPPPMMPKWSESYNNFTKGNLLGMIANMGNKSNFWKMAEGWGVAKDDREALWNWVIANSTREDWVRAQKMGDNIFNKIVQRGDIVQERVNGSTVDKIPLTPFELDFKDGKPQLQLKGWYHRLIPDQIWYGEKQRSIGGFNDSNFGHINTSDGWTRARTGAVYPIDLSFGMLPARISQMVHDITHREVILEAQKIMMNNGVRNAITKYWGKEYTDLMEPYLREMAGQYAMPSENMARMEQASEFLRGNVMTTYIGFNPSTPMKHFPTALFQSLREGKGYFLKAYMQQWLGLRPEVGNYWGQYAMDHSEVLQGRDRHWRDSLGNSLEFPKADFDFTDWRQWRNEISRWGSKIVAWSDMASAKALWIGQFQRYLDDGINARDAISRADQDVIRQHGALLMSNKPEIVRQAGNLHGWLTSVYGFMGERFQRLRETAWKTNESWHLMEQKQFDKAAKMIPGIAADYLTYVVQVGLWEEAATAALSDEHRSLGMRLFNIAFGNIASSIIYAREIYHAAETGQDPGTGLLSSAAADVSNVIRDAFRGREALNRQHAGRTIQHLFTMLGIGAGLATKPVARVGRFGVDVATGQQHPKSVTDYWRGLTRGQVQERQRK